MYIDFEYQVKALYNLRPHAHVHIDIILIKN